jgi:hypothetical protein
MKGRTPGAETRTLKDFAGIAMLFGKMGKVLHIQRALQSCSAQGLGCRVESLDRGGDPGANPSRGKNSHGSDGLRSEHSITGFSTGRDSARNHVEGKPQ